MPLTKKSHNSINVPLELSSNLSNQIPNDGYVLFQYINKGKTV